MSRFATRVTKIKAYWADVFGDGPAFESCAAASVALLAVLYFIGLVWMVPASVATAFFGKEKQP